MLTDYDGLFPYVFSKALCVMEFSAVGVFLCVHGIGIRSFCFVGGPSFGSEEGVGGGRGEVILSFCSLSGKSLSLPVGSSLLSDCFLQFCHLERVQVAAVFGM